MKDEIDSLELSLLNIGYADLNASWNFGPICSAISRLYWVVEGQATVIFNGVSHLLRPEHLYLIPAFVSHCDCSDTIFKHYYIHVADTSQNILKLYEKYDLPFELPISENDKFIFTGLLELCPQMSLLRHTPDTYESSSCYLQYAKRFDSLPIDIKMRIKGELLILLSGFFKVGKERYKANDERISRALFMIDRNISNELTIDELSSGLSLCKDHFIRLFHKETGYTPNDYIMRKKVMRAQLLLFTKDLPIKQVAIESGFSNLSYFYRVFNKITGMTPMTFKKQNI